MWTRAAHDRRTLLIKRNDLQFERENTEPISLRTRLLILVIAAMLVPAILVGLRFAQNRTSEISAALANLSATADDISKDLD